MRGFTVKNSRESIKMEDFAKIKFRDRFLIKFYFFSMFLDLATLPNLLYLCLLLPCIEGLLNNIILNDKKGNFNILIHHFN